MIRSLTASLKIALIDKRNKELRELCRSPLIDRAMISSKFQWDRHVPYMSETRNAYRILVLKPFDKTKNDGDIIFGNRSTRL